MSNVNDVWQILTEFTLSLWDYMLIFFSLSWTNLLNFTKFELQIWITNGNFSIKLQKANWFLSFCSIFPFKVLLTWKFSFLSYSINHFFLLKGDGLHSLHRSRSRGDGFPATGTRSSPLSKWMKNIA